MQPSTHYAYKVTKRLYGNQQKLNIEAVNDYPPIRFKRKFPIRRSLKKK